MIITSANRLGHVIVVILLTTLLGSCSRSVNIAPANSDRAPPAIHKITIAYANSYLVTQGRNSFLFDAGLERDGPELAERIRTLGVEPQALRAIIVSHGHHDHAGGAAYLNRVYGVPVIVGRGDAGMLARDRNDPICPQGFFAQRRFATDQAGTYRGVRAAIEIEQPTALSTLTGIDGRVVPLPGHTPGSLVLVVDRYAFVGDLLRGGIFTPRRATTHFYMCDLEDNRRDLAALLRTIAPNAQSILTGHFGPVSRASVQRLANRS
ncbi:MAG: MBL fold metallo-hydrolase [Pseudomonadota bacterium]